MANGRMKMYFIRVTSVAIFNALVAMAEQTAEKHGARFEARRNHGYYELGTGSEALWREVYIYGQMLAQAQDEYIDGGEDITS